MLYNLDIGSNTYPGEWKLIEDQYGSQFLERHDIKQRIRINRYIEFDQSLLENATQTSCGTMINLPSNIKWVNNNQNLNPMLTSMSERDSDKSEQHILYVTIDNSLQLLSYRSSYPILQTYHHVGKYQGCAIVFTNNDISENRLIIELTVKNKETNRYQFVKVYMNPDSMNIYYIQEDVHSKAKIDMIRNKEKEMGRKMLRIKIRPKRNEMITNTYFTDTEHLELTNEITKYIKNKNIIVFNNEEPSFLIKSTMKKELTEKKIRAFTMVGINIPYNIWKDLHQLYVFSYDTEKEVLKCVKSN